MRALLDLARHHLDRRLRQREDEDDVLQSMYASFCLRQRRGNFDLSGRDDLWKLLVTVTLRKARNAARSHRREVRDYRRECAEAGGTIRMRKGGPSNRWMRRSPRPRTRRPSMRSLNGASAPWTTPSCGGSPCSSSKVTRTRRSPGSWTTARSARSNASSSASGPGGPGTTTRRVKAGPGQHHRALDPRVIANWPF